jgi:hypothetical protein
MYLEDAYYNEPDESDEHSEYTVGSDNEEEEEDALRPARVVNIPIAVATVGVPLEQISEPQEENS